ncbi:hypothetical protein DMB66_47440 [Actinoplanes sp. ATCC 53533]|nr:hypothetical protein DMB66_47440 [Actinoplanes sp. ATCC 53533]
MVIGEIVEAEVVEGEIVDGPVLNTGDEAPRLPFRAGLLDARYLRESTRFSRGDVGDLSELVEGIRERRGVKLPMIVLSVRESGSVHEDFEIVDGLRRKRAAIEAGYYAVPCWILDDEADIELILDMLAVNENRKDYDSVEIAQAYQTILDFGWSEEQIAEARRVHVNEVRTAVRARQLSAPAHRALNAGTLTFEMVQAIDEFADDPEAQRKLYDKIGDEWNFRQELARQRNRLTYQRERDLAKARLLLAGVDVTPRPRSLGYSDGPIEVDKLVDADGKDLDIDEVKTLKGFHGFVEKNGAEARTVVYCDDPAAHGYTRRTSVPAQYHGMSEEDVAAQQEQERLKTERIERLRLAAGVRREFVVSAYGSAKAARTLFLDALRAVNLGSALTRSPDLHDLFTSLGGSDPDTIATAGEDRQRRTLAVRFVCRQEANLDTLVDRLANPYTYGLDENAALAWYERLAAQGYPLTEDEQELCTDLRATIDARLAQAESNDEDIVDAELVEDGESGALHEFPPATGAGEPEPVDAELVDGPLAETEDTTLGDADLVEVSFGTSGHDDTDDLTAFEAAA